jgi:1,2-diacylglycerol 3-beta-galactosyltransferase
MTVPVLLLFGDTGGGHRSAAAAVADALEAEYPGAFDPWLYDPLSASKSALMLRSATGLYGPTVRFAPRLWGAVYRASDSRPMAELLRRTWLRLADPAVTGAVTAQGPAVVLSFHPLITAAAVRAVRGHTDGTPVVTVVTDLITTHATWRCDGASQIVVPSAAVKTRCEERGIPSGRCLDLGLPVGSAFTDAPLSPHEKTRLRSRLGIDPWRFLVVFAGGAEGAGPIARNAAAVTGAFDDVDVVAICGRNRRLERRLVGLAALRPPRLRVEGFVDNMADWYRAADVVVTKAGPQTIAESTCSGAALLITSHLPGQERGNTERVVQAGAGVHTPRTADLLATIARLKSDPDALEALRRASLAMARPDAASRVAALVADLTLPTEEIRSKEEMMEQQHGAA